MTPRRRHSWLFVGTVPLLLVIIATLQTGSPVQAQVLDVDVESTVVPVGDTVQLTVLTTSGGTTLQARVTGPGDAVFQTTGTTETELSTDTGFGYGGNTIATTLVAVSPGEITVELVDPGTGQVEASLNITILPSEGEGGFTPPIAPQIGVHISRWGGGSLQELIAAAPAGTTSIWVTVDGEFIGYIPGAPAFVNAGFLAAFPGGELPADTPLLVAVT